jgi:hypothetical protein
VLGFGADGRETEGVGAAAAAAAGTAGFAATGRPFGN